MYNYKSEKFSWNAMPVGIKEAIIEFYGDNENFDVNSLTKSKKDFSVPAQFMMIPINKSLFFIFPTFLFLISFIIIQISPLENHINL